MAYVVCAVAEYSQSVCHKSAVSYQKDEQDDQSNKVCVYMRLSAWYNSSLQHSGVSGKATPIDASV